MHDLDTIRRLNNEAVQKAIRAKRAAGLFVLVRYTGLHLMGFETFTTDVEALAASEHIALQVSDRVELLPPLGPAEAALVAGRDQSEDYTAPKAAPAADNLRDQIVELKSALADVLEYAERYVDLSDAPKDSDGFVACAKARALLA